MDTLYSKLDLLADDTVPVIFERNKLKKLKLNVDVIQTTIDNNLKELREGITTLSQQQSEQEQTGARDTEAGEDQLIQLEKKVEKLEVLLQETPKESSSSSSKPRFTAIDIQDNGDILQLQQRIMDDQDQDLDQLSEAIKRQRELGSLIGQELETHAQLIDETEEMVDRSDERLRETRRKLDKLKRKVQDNKSICIVIALILILFILVGLFK